MARRHPDGKVCDCVPVGRCVPCSVGKHESCNDAVSTLGCQAACEGGSLPFSGTQPSL